MSRRAVGLATISRITRADATPASSRARKQAWLERVREALPRLCVRGETKVSNDLFYQSVE